MELSKRTGIIFTPSMFCIVRMHDSKFQGKKERTRENKVQCSNWMAGSYIRNNGLCFIIEKLIKERISDDKEHNKNHGGIM